MAFSSSALPYAKYKSAISGACSSNFFVLQGAAADRSGRAMRATQACHLRYFECRRVVLHRLLVLLEREGAFGVFDGVLE